MATYHDEDAHLRELYRQTVEQCEMLGIRTRDENFDQIALGELRNTLQRHCERYGIPEGFTWAGTDPMDWPHTPPLEQFRSYIEANASNAWKIEAGHYHNALDAAFEEIDRLRAVVEPEV